MPHLACIDPGGTTTGIVLLHYEDDLPAALDGSWSLEGGILPFLNWWRNEQCWLPLHTVVCEQFVQRNVAGADLSPLRLQGAIEVLCEEASVHCALQPASGKNTAVTDDAMNRAGFRKSFFSGDHHQDRWEALRHGLWFLKRNKHLPTLNAMYPRD